MELKFYLKSKLDAGNGTVNLRFAPVEGAPENEEFLAASTGEIVLDGIKEDTVADLFVPTEEERTGMRDNPVPMGNPARIPTGKQPVAYQKFTVTINLA